MTNLVSILIPAYNAQHWIAATIRSAMDQTWPTTEIIVVDDGSRDDTLAIARTFEGPRVTVVTQTNRGAPAARNHALSLSRGDYIQWLDADDLLAPDKIARQMQAVTGGRDSRVLLTAPFGTFFFRHQRAKYQPSSLWKDLAPLEWMKIKFTENAWMNPAAWLVSRALVESAGPWDERLSRSGDDDGEYLCRVVLASEHVKFVPAAKCFYRVGQSGSLSERRSADAYESLFLATTLSIEHLLSRLNNEETRAACIALVQNRLWHFHPHNAELVKRFEYLARELGADTLQLRETWKYKLAGKYFGWEAARRMRSLISGAKTLAAKNADRLLWMVLDDGSWKGSLRSTRRSRSSLPRFEEILKDVDNDASA